MKILQDFIAPLVRLEGTTTNIGSHHGTAFFINPSGIFLTARHVVEECQQHIDKHGGRGALVMRHSATARVAGLITQVEYADPPFDIAIGRVDKASKSFFLFDPAAKLWMWTDVYAAGYPVSAASLSGPMKDIDARGFKGTILRQVRRGQLGTDHPDLLELSFAITNGLSGAPLVLRDVADHEGKPIPYFFLAGVCVGSTEAEVVAFSHTEVQDAERTFKEKTSRIEQYGIAHDLRSLGDWRPQILDGKSLKEVVAVAE